MRTHVHRRGLRYHTGGVLTVPEYLDFAISKKSPFLISLVGVVVPYHLPPSSASEIISARIKATREARGITASQFSRSVGVTPADDAATKPAY